MNSYPALCLCAMLLLLVHVSLAPLCVCLSHPSRAIHLYLSETSVEIDSSDGMISEASTKDPSSSESEGPSSDDDDDGDDSDWGCGDRQGDGNTEVCQEACWRDAQMAPMDYVPQFCWVETRWRECLCCRCDENEHIIQEKREILFESLRITTKRSERGRSTFWSRIKSSRTSLLLRRSSNIQVREEMLDLTCRDSKVRGL